LGDTNSSSSYVENTLNAVQNTGVHNFDFSNLQDPIPGFFAEASPPGRRFFSQTPDLPSYGSLANPSLQTPFLGEQENGEESQSTANAEHLLESGMNADEETQNAPNPLECPPTDDFEWDEQYASVIESAGQDHSHWTSKTNEAEGEEDVIDGMASLTVDEREGGYLGVASGAALLRIIDPQSHTRKKSSTLRRQPGRFSFRHAESAMPLYDMPNSNRHILDTMIDSYFRLYHVSYPVIHEPTFRAQYSEVIPRPNGDCWLVLAYVIAAIGVYTTSTSLQDNDLPLFSQAKSMLSINFLEAGNLTLVQALVLISNYLQKRNKPNSGYNYIGLAVRMAMGLGLHKEFQGWNISPLKMEIRRRVWWTLGIFELGATITFSRPMAWPSKGIEVAFPMNVNDRVCSNTWPFLCTIGFTP
jgi:transcriptional regulatory protein GAL4